MCSSLAVNSCYCFHKNLSHMVLDYLKHIILYVTYFQLLFYHIPVAISASFSLA